MSIQFRSAIAAGLCSAAICLAPNISAGEITNLTVKNISNADQLRGDGVGLAQEYRTELSPASAISRQGSEQSFDTDFRWFQGMRVNQPEGPNTALTYRKNIGFDINFTVEDPENNGYTIDVDYGLDGVITSIRETDVRMRTASGLLLGYFNKDDGNGLVHRSGFSVSGGTVRVEAAETPNSKTRTFALSKSYNPGETFYGTRNFQIRFSSFPSPALLNLFGNNGAGEGVIQFGLNPTRDEFVNGSNTNGKPLNDLGLKATIRVTGLLEDVDGDGVEDDIDNCPSTANPDQSDLDGDGIGDVCDNCAETYNPDQKDSNANGIGDVCDYIDVSLAFDLKKLPCLNPKGSVPLSVLSNLETFDAGRIDSYSLFVDTVSAPEAHGRVHPQDINGDGLADAVLHLPRGAVCRATASDPAKRPLTLTIEGTIDRGAQKFRGQSQISIIKR